MGRELACADTLNKTYYNNQLSDKTLWMMATINAAIATGTDDVLGSLEVGKTADIAVYDGTVASHYRAIIEMGPEGAALVLRNGEPLYGEPAIVTATGRTCEAVDVCGAERALCSQEEYGLSFSDIQSAVPSAYPAYFCADVPTDEPTCTPSHPGQFTGETTDDDIDGDGIANDEDNCPATFNPIRPIDGNVQTDADGDGDGDACDETALPADLDGDGTANADDNCPFIANVDQADGDADNRGDACDKCPDIPNPDSICPETVSAATIEQIRTDSSINEGDKVSVLGVVVTGIGDSGFTIQDPSDSDNRYCGLYIYQSSGITVKIGDNINLTGYVGDYFGEAQLQDPEVTASGSSATISPASLTAENAADEAYEGVLVKIIDGTVTDDNYDCSVDGSSCSDEGLWEIDGADGVLVYDRLYQDSDWLDQVSTLPVVGVMNYRWNRRRVMPRTAADFGS
jgi:hypothetical protein